MADLRDVLRHLVTHAEGYATQALRQEALDVIDEAFSPAPPEAQAPPTVPDEVPAATFTPAPVA